MYKVDKFLEKFHHINAIKVAMLPVFSDYDDVQQHGERRAARDQGGGQAGAGPRPGEDGGDQPRGE